MQLFIEYFSFFEQVLSLLEWLPKIFYQLLKRSFLPKSWFIFVKID